MSKTSRGFAMKLSMPDRLFKERIDKEWEDAAGEKGSTTARARLRNHEQDRKLLTKRLHEKKKKERQKAVLWTEKEEERLSRQRADEVLAKANRRTTNMRLRLRRDLINKVRSEESDWTRGF